MSATDASSARKIASASAARARPCSPAPRVIVRPRMRSSAITGQGLADPNGVIVPRSYPVARLATSASGRDRRLTPSSALNFGQEMTRSPGTSTNRKSSSPRRTTSVLTTSAGATPRAPGASAKLRTGPCRITRWARPTASAASSAGVDTVQYPAPTDTRALPELVAAACQVGGLGGVARQLDGFVVRRARLLTAAQSAQQVGAGRMVGVIAGQLALKTVDGRQCHLRAVKLGDRDGPVEGDDRRGVEADELIVEGDDLRPVGVAYVAGGGVHGADRGEDLVATRSHPGGQALAHQPVTLGDQRRVPGPAVLLVEGYQFAAGRNPGGAAGLGEEHQCQQPGHLTVLRHEGTDQASEPDRLGGQVVTHGIGVGAGRQVALVEDEEEDGEYAGDAGREILRGRHPIRDASRLDLGLRAGDPPPHCGLLHQEGTGDLGHGQAADHPQRQRHAGLHRERRVTAGEDQPEPLVVDGAGRLGRVVVVQQPGLLLLVIALVLAPDPVDGLAVGGGGQPGAGIGGYAVGRPPLNGGRERLGRRLLGDVEVTETPGQGGDHPGPLLVVRLGNRLPDAGPAHRNGRTSTFRLQAFDPSAASLSTTSRSGASRIQKPARYSFDSTKGPSVNIASSPRLSMTVAELGAARPPAKTQ